MQTCKRCLYNDYHPLGLLINDNALCSGCETHEEKDILDWKKRKYEFEALIDYQKKQSKNPTYDCVIPITGDAEDFFVVGKVLEFGLNPLLVCVNDYFKNEIGWKNIQTLITHYDVDSFLFNPDIRDYKELIKTSLRKFDNIRLPYLLAHTAFPVHVAIERKINLVIWGQLQAIEQVGKFSHKNNVEMTKWSRREHDTIGQSFSNLIGTGAQINLNRITNYYQYPKATTALEKVKGVYLSNYFRWDPLTQNKSSVENGFTPQTNFHSFDIYERAGCSVYYGIHDLLKLKNHGYRKVRDHLTREIRHGRVSREAAIQIEKLYSLNKINIKPFFDWLGVSHTGYEWFIEHRLVSVKESIGPTHENIETPKIFENYLSPSECPKQEFLNFYKGI